MKKKTMSRERYDELFEKWKPQQIKEEFWQFIDFLNKRKQPIQRFLEVGTAFGTTIPFFAELSNDLAITMDIRALDFEHLEDEKVKYYVGSSLDPTLIEWAKHDSKGELFDLIFIDGDHRYEFVKKDYLVYKDLVKKGGIIAFHDVVILDEVKRFWDELSPTLENTKVFYLTDGTGNGIGVIIND